VDPKRFLDDLTPILQRLHVPVNSARWNEFLPTLRPHTKLLAAFNLIESDPTFSKSEAKSEVRPEHASLRQLAVMMLLVQKKLVRVESPTTDPAAAAPAPDYVPAAVAAARVPVARVSPPPAASPPPAVQAVPVHAPRPGEIKRPGYTSIDPAEVQSGKVSDHSPIYGRIGFGHTELGYFSMNVRCWNTYPKAGGGMQVDSLLNASHKDFFKNSQARVMAAMAQLGQEGQPEIACFQEVNGPMGQILAKELQARGYQVFYDGVRKEGDPDDWDGRLTAFKLPVGAQAIRYGTAHQTVSKPNKGFQAFAVHIPGEKSLLLINGHKAPANPPTKDEHQRATAIASHIEFVTRTTDLMRRFPTSVLMGDLNGEADDIQSSYEGVGTVCRSDRLTYIGQRDAGPSRPDHAVVGRGVTSVSAG
jgi:exonuclease III